MSNSDIVRLIHTSVSNMWDSRGSESLLTVSAKAGLFISEAAFFKFLSASVSLFQVPLCRCELFAGFPYAGASYLPDASCAGVSLSSGSSAQLTASA